MKLLQSLFVCCAFAVVQQAHADLVGTSVTGSLRFNGVPTNYFNAANGFVPAGYGNSSGSPTVTIGPGPEFGFNDSANLDTANFTGNMLTITGECLRSSCTGNGSVQYSFTDAAFAGLNLTFLSNGLNLTGSLNGTTLTLQQGTGIPANGTASSTFSLTPAAVTPEPSSFALLGTGILGVIGVARKRFA